MEVIHAHLNRSYTAPAASTHARLNNQSSSTTTTPPSFQSHTSSFYSAFSRNPSRTSQLTADPSAPLLSLSSAASNPPLYNGGPVVASENVINKIADKETSLFQICVNLRNRLEALPEFQEQLLDVESADDEVLDPVTLLWRTFRRGYPLMTIYNAMDPPLRLTIDEARVPEPRRGKAAAFKFLQACVDQLHFPTEECFIISDLYGTDTSGFVKVARVVNRVVDILVAHGYLLPAGAEPTADTNRAVKRTQRQHIIDELVSTERTYVQHLEVLQAFKKLVEQRGFIPGDAIHDIFLNLNNLLDFQRRFLIRVEQTNALPEEEQNWGKLFCSFAQGFDVYETYIANQKKCEETAMREFDKLKETGGPAELRQIVESPTHLTAFLLKPFQRLSKYPLLLRELRDKGGLDQERRDDISEGMEVPQAVLERTNEWIDREERQEAVQILKSQVEDWKGHRVEVFGDLLLHGTFVVMKGDTSKENEREYRMYLFERILLCCKEANSSKQKGRKQSQVQLDRKARPRLVLSGRIFMQNVTETVSVSKQGSYTCQVFWKGDEAIEFFVVRFTSEEVMRKWRDQIELQRKMCREQAYAMAQANASEEYYYAGQSGSMDHAYEDNVDEEEYVVMPYRFSGISDSGQSRNGSNSSLRGRATATEATLPTPLSHVRSLPSQHSAEQPLTLRTQHLQNMATSAAERGESHFSPTLESPISQRTSASSGIGMYHLPRQSFGQAPYHSEESNRFTAPTLGRARDVSNGYYQPSRPGQYSGSPAHYAALQQTRVRSASSPDVHGAGNPARRGVMTAPPVPHVPAHLANNYGISRDCSRSPTFNGTGGASPVLGQSPNARRSGARIEDVVHGADLRRRLEHDSYDGSHGLAAPSPSRSLASMESDTSMLPAQVKVKVKVPSEGSTMTLVVSYHITYATLKERIDAKLARHSNLSLATGSVKLKFFYDDEFISIQNDEDVQTAFETWKEQRPDLMSPGMLGEIEFFCHRPA